MVYWLLYFRPPVILLQPALNKLIIIRRMDANNGCDSRLPIARRRVSVSLKKPVPQVQNAEQLLEYDPKECRMLAHCFSSNINAYYGKKMKNVLGDLEEWYKIPLTKEERQVLEQNLDSIIDKNIGRLVRDSLARNSFISKNISDYVEVYKRDLKNGQSNLQDMPVGQTLEQQDRLKMQQKFRKHSLKHRPFSSHRVNTRKLSQVNAQNPELLQRNRTGDAILQNQDSTVESQCYVYIRQNCRKASRNKMGTKYRIAGNERLGLFEQFKNGNDSQILKSDTEIVQAAMNSYCSDKGRRASLLWRNKDRQNEFYVPIESKSIAKTNINKFFSAALNVNTPKPRSWDEVEKQKIKNKILSINGCLSANIAQSQGYRPKSKCWGSTVSTFGKLSPVPVKQPVQGSRFLLASVLRYKP